MFVVMEKCLMDKLSSKVGFPDGEGIFCPGTASRQQSWLRGLGVWLQG